MPVREVRPISSGVNWPASAGSGERTSALSIGVADLVGSLFSCPGVTLRPRLASPCGFSPGSEIFCFGREKMPKKSSNSATQTPTSRNSDLLLSRPSSCRLSAGFCCRRAVWNAERNASRQFPLPGSSGADSSLAISASGFAGAVFSSLFVFSVSMVCCLPQSADSKTDGRQGRLVDRAGLRHLQEQRLHRPLVRRTLEKHHAVGAFPWSDPPPAQAEIDHRQLLRRGPMLVLDQLSRLVLAAQLDLRRHQQDGVLAGVHNREQNNHLLASIEDFADARPQPVALHLVAFRTFAIQHRHGSLFLAFQQAVERAWFGLGRHCFHRRTGGSERGG